jgi:hypothetical protein
MSLEVSTQKIHKVAESGAFFTVVMRPERLEYQLPVLQETHAEQVFESIWVQRVSLQVEEQVARIRLRHAVEAATRFARDHLGFVFPGLPFVVLQRRLAA